MILIGETNPYGSFEAIVEDDGRTVYLYLQSVREGGPMKAVWVANRVPAPHAEDILSMQQGTPPLMPVAGTRHPQGHPGFHPENLTLVWFEEGDAVALLDRGTPVAVLPSWAGMEGFPGYSAEAIGEVRLAWELGPALPALQPRIEESQRYWARRADPQSWPEIRDRGLAHLERILGPHQRYWAADGGQFPPRALLLFNHPSVTGVSVLTTLGMSAQRLPQVEMAFEDPRPHRRVELALATSGDPTRLTGLLSGMLRFPWSEGSWLGDLHTYSFANPSPNIGESALLLMRQPPPQHLQVPDGLRTVPAPNLGGLPDPSGDPVTYLWLVPISEPERRYAEEHGSEALAERLEQDSRGWIWS